MSSLTRGAMNKSEPAQDNAHPVTRLQKTKKKTKEKNKQILHLCKTQRAHAWRVWRQTAHSYFFLFILPPPPPVPSSWSTFEMLLWQRGKLSSSERGLAVWVPSPPYQGHLLAWKSAGLYALEEEKRVVVAGGGGCFGVALLSLAFSRVFISTPPPTPTRLRFHTLPPRKPRHVSADLAALKADVSATPLFAFSITAFAFCWRVSAFAKATNPEDRNPPGTRGGT